MRRIEYCSSFRSHIFMFEQHEQSLESLSIVCLTVKTEKAFSPKIPSPRAVSANAMANFWLRSPSSHPNRPSVSAKIFSARERKPAHCESMDARSYPVTLRRMMGGSPLVRIICVFSRKICLMAAIRGLSWRNPVPKT